MRTPRFLFFALAGAGCWLPAQAQQPQPGPLARFATWQPKENLESLFVEGYQQHLAWHRRQPDPWSWYGWLVISGPRQGLFVDATFGHAAADFDHAVNPAADAADNALHTKPFATFTGSFTVALLPEASTPGALRLTAPYLRTYRLLPTRTAELRALLTRLQAVAARQYPTQALYCFEYLDGGKVPQALLVLPFANQADALVLANLLAELEALDVRHVVQAIEAETLRYRSDLSYFPTP